MPNIKDFAVTTDGANVQGTLRDKLPVVPNVPPTGRKAIGPRVSFHFITEAWNKENSYEYYDVVNVSDNSYIAIKNVPNGIEITNTEYWFHWADPNAQYSELYNIVLTYDERITNAVNSVSQLTQTVNELAAKLDDLAASLIAGKTYADIAANGFVFKQPETE